MKRFTYFLTSLIFFSIAIVSQSQPTKNRSVTTQGMLSGSVFNCDSELPMQNVTVKAIGSQQFVTETDIFGDFEMLVESGVYNVEFILVGYDTISFIDISVNTGGMTQIVDSMCESPYPVSNLIVARDGNTAIITWELPRGPYEIMYEDGFVNDYTIWSQPGGAVAVRFTPVGFPATAIGGRVYVGDGSFPVGGNFLGTDIDVGIVDDDGANGLPGTILDSMSITVNNYGWVEFYDIFNVDFTEGDFYVAMWQKGVASNSAPIGIDTDNPTTYKSYVKSPTSNSWSISPYQDFMIRAYVDGPNPGVVSNNGSSRNIDYYTLARVSGFDPCLGPETGTLTPIANPTVFIYHDINFGGNPPGIYAYAVKATYESGNSGWEFSSTITSQGDKTVTYNISLCNGGNPENSTITMANVDTCQYIEYQLITDATGVAIIDTVLNGTYNIIINHAGYEAHRMDSVIIYSDTAFNVELIEKMYPPRNLVVDSMTNIATWDAPLVTALPLETFEDTIFPPPGWQAVSFFAGWYRTDHYFSYWAIPPGDAFYAVSNSDAQGSAGNARDYLITPQLDLCADENYALNFSSFYDGMYGFSAYVEYSYDNGITWELISSLSPANEWTTVSVDISSLSGPASQPVWIAFHSDDHGNWSSGWAVDNVKIEGGYADINGYYVFLNDELHGMVDSSVTTYTFNNLPYLDIYTACVKAIYDCGSSDAICDSWTSYFLHPPRNFTDEYLFGTDDVPLKWNPPMMDATTAAAFNVVYSGPQLVATGPNVDASEEITIIEFEDESSRDFGDFQFSFPDLGGPGEAGCESDGEFIYTTLWNGSDFFKYDLSGNLLETFTIPGVENVRDMAYDGEFFYGAAANTTVFVMDFSTQTLVTTFTAPTNVRAIAYNDDDQTFYANNWGTDIVNFDAMGNTIGSFTPSVTSIYGLAYDKWSEFAPRLWAYDQGANNTIQFALPNGTPTGVTFDVSAIAGATGVAGGLFEQMSLFDPHEVTLGGNAQDDIVWGIEIAQFTGGSGIVPEGLLSFNLYRDGMNISNIPYEGQGVNEWISVVDMNLMPGRYIYDVSAIYDLTSYGYPGQTGESVWHGADTVDVAWGFELPFYEGWDNGTFSFNNWQTYGLSDNWIISILIGDPEPSAEFSWDPLPDSNYSSTLVSNPINAHNITNGRIYFDFDIKLDDRNSTGDEKMLVEIYDGNSWNEIAEFANNGSFDFDTNHIDITNYAFSRVFQIRFNAVGQNSFDIQSWFIDNIHLYRECEPPFNLTGEAIYSPEYCAKICWESTIYSQWFYYDNDFDVEYVWGGSNDWESDIAIKIDAADLANYSNSTVTKYRAFIDNRLFDAGTVSVKIYQGNYPDPTTPIYEEDVTDQLSNPDDWNEFTLSQGVPFDNTQSLWLGMYFTGEADTYGPGITIDMGTYDNNGDLLYESGVWNNLTAYGVNNRAWLLRGFVTDNRGTSFEIGGNTIPLPKANNLTPANSIVTKKANISRISADKERSLSYFNIYKSITGDDYEIIDTVAVEPGIGYYCYNHIMTYPLDYYYKVTSVYVDNADFCESAPARAYELPQDDFVYIIWEGINDMLSSSVSIFPNPTSDNININSTLPIKHITISSYFGQLVYNSSVENVTNTIVDVRSLKSGVYLIKIITDKAEVTKRMVVAR